MSTSTGCFFSWFITNSVLDSREKVVFLYWLHLVVPQTIGLYQTVDTGLLY